MSFILDEFATIEIEKDRENKRINKLAKDKENKEINKLAMEMAIGSMLNYDEAINTINKILYLGGNLKSIKKIYNDSGLEGIIALETITTQMCTKDIVNYNEVEALVLMAIGDVYD